MGSPVIFNGKYSKILTQLGIKFSSDTLITASSTDPRTTTYDAPSGSIHLLTTTPPKVLVKLNNGNNNSWGDVSLTALDTSAFNQFFTSSEDTIQEALDYIDNNAVKGTAEATPSLYIPIFDGNGYKLKKSVLSYNEGTSTLNIASNLTVSGTTTQVNSEVTTTDRLVVLNSGEVGAGVTNNIAGIEIDRGSLNNYQFIFDESTDTFRIGEIGSTQAVATREDFPQALGVMFWDSSTSKLIASDKVIISPVLDRMDVGTSTLDISSNSVYISKLFANSILLLDSNKKLTYASLTDGKLLIGSTGSMPVVASLTGTANQVNITNGAGSITLSLPQNIHTTATPIFDALTATKKVEIGGDDSTSWLKLVPRTTANRTLSPTAGMTNYNATTNSIEYYNGTAWISLVNSINTLTEYNVANEATSAIGTFTDLVSIINGEVTIDKVSGNDDLRAAFSVTMIKRMVSGVAYYEIASSTISGDTFDVNTPLATFSMNSTSGVLSITLPNYPNFDSAWVRYKPYYQNTNLATNGTTVNDQKTVQVVSTSTTIAGVPTPIQYIANSGSPITLTITTAVGNNGARVWVKNIGAGAVTLDPNASETIDGMSTLVLDQYDAITLTAYNGNWYII